MLNINDLHAHIETNSRDCDGLYKSNRTRANVDGMPRYDFMSDTFAAYAPAHTFHGATIKVDADGFEVVEHTEEGYRNVEVRWCWETECKEDAWTCRDLSAEAAGY